MRKQRCNTRQWFHFLPRSSCFPQIYIVCVPFKMQLNPAFWTWIRPAPQASWHPPPRMAGEGLCPCWGNTYKQKGRMRYLRRESGWHLWGVPAAPQLPPALHTFPSTAQSGCFTHPGHTNSWLPQNSPDTAVVACEA